MIREKGLAVRGLTVSVSVSVSVAFGVLPLGCVDDCPECGRSYAEDSANTVVTIDASKEVGAVVDAWLDAPADSFADSSAFPETFADAVTVTIADADADVLSSPPPSTWSEAFPATSAGGLGTAQCTSWNKWRASLSASRVYTKVTMGGTFHTTGTTCMGPEADRICQALRQNKNDDTTCAGQAWGIHDCGGTVGVSLGFSFCSCLSAPQKASIVQPCDPKRGGVNTSTCDPPAQTMTVVCE